MTAITSPGPTAYPTADPIIGMTVDPTATYPAGLGPTHPPLPPVPPPAGPRPPWYQQKRYAFPLILLVLLGCGLPGCAKVEDPNTPVQGSSVEQEIRELNEMRGKEWGESSTGVGPEQKK